MRKVKRAAAWAIPAALLAGYAGQVRADDHADEQKMRAEEKMVLVDTIDVQSDKGIGAFDISFVDPKLGLYVLADRTNASVDFFNTRDNTFIKRVGGFKGVVFNPGTTVANNNLSGPDGVVVVGHKEVWAGDGDSTVKVINIASSSVVDTISTGGLFRCDEMAFDSDDHILAVANNADSPAFITMINTDTHKIVGKIVFDGTNNTPDATNGIEQSQWSPETGLFYVSVPQVGSSDPAAGGLSVIDPATKMVTRTFKVPDCSPAGLTLGPNHQALIGCSASFGVSPNVVTQSQIIDIKTGKIVKSIPQVGGSDEVWFDSGSGHYYLAARANTDNTGKIVPSLGTIDAKTNMFDSIVPTSTSAHSVAADSKTRHVYVPIGFPAAGTSDPTNPCPVVTKGCIAVFLPSAPDAEDDDRGRDDHGR
jgi:hypothetical protein